MYTYTHIYIHNSELEFEWAEWHTIRMGRMVKTLAAKLLAKLVTIYLDVSRPIMISNYLLDISRPIMMRPRPK